MSGPSIARILLVVAVLAAVPLLTASNAVLNFLAVTLMIALVAQGWNVLGGYGGQYSFGHAAFFGTGAYVTAILQMRYGVNAWIGFAGGIAGGAAVGAVIGGLVFRAGLRSSYFALVTLAFAEVLRIPVANTLMAKGVVPFSSDFSLGTIGLKARDLPWYAFERADVVKLDLTAPPNDTRAHRHLIFAGRAYKQIIRN